jgi:hypothetical protein
MISTTNIRRGILLILALCIATSFHFGCTQDGGGGAGTENVPSLTGDGLTGSDDGSTADATGEPVTALSLVRVDSTELPLDSKPLPLMLSVKASFGVPMDAASVEGALSLTDPNGNLVNVTRTWDAEETALSLKPVKALAPGSTYTVELTANAISKRGLPAEPAVETFTTMRSMTTNSDLNGDGVGDFAIGALGQNDSGAVYVYSGKDPSTPMATINFIAPNTKVKFGSTVAIIDDLNGDGAAELLIGAPELFHNAGGTNIKNAGGVFLISGKKLAGNVALTNVDVAIYGSDMIGLGRSIADAGDIDGDGIHDIMISSNPVVSNKVFFFSGASLIDSDPNTPALLFETDAMASVAGDLGTYFGLMLTGIGDLDLDGRDDVLINAPGANTGHAYIFSGASLVINTNLGDMIASLAGDAGDQGFGMAVASAGDFDADGYPDVLLSDMNKDTAAGAAYVYAGKDLVERGLFGIDRAARTIPGNAAEQRLGSSLAGLGDMNLDGIDDIAIGSSQDPMPSPTPMGHLQLFAGPDAAALGPEILPMTDAHYGLVLAPLGDIDGKGKPDFLIGDPYYGMLGGSAFLMYGEDLKAFKLLKPSGLTAKAFFGISLAGTHAAKAALPF